MPSPRPRSLLRKIRDLVPGKPDRVIIYGTQAPAWISALGPGAAVWRKIPQIKDVVLRPHNPFERWHEPRLRHRRTVVIPLMEPHIETFPLQYKALAPDAVALKTLRDKAAFAAFAKKIGLDGYCPTSYGRVMDATFPCVLKRVDLSSSNGVVLVKSYEHLQSLFADDEWNGKKFILQSFAPGAQEYVTHCVCRDGDILWHCSYEYGMSSPDDIRSAETIKAVRPYKLSDRHLDVIGKFLKPLSYDGPCNVDYKISDEGELVVLEINPRLGGSLMDGRHVDDLAVSLSHIIDNARFYR
jgi:hypothetical protein